MHAQRSTTTVMLAIIAILGLAQCGGQKSKSDGIAVTNSPDQPIVFNVSVAGIAEANWFGFGVTIENNTDSPFILIGLSAEITAIDQTGTSQVFNKAWVPESENTSFIRADGTVLECVYSSYGVWTPGQKKAMRIDNGNPDCAAYDAPFVSGGYPAGPNGKNFRYKVKIKPLGFFFDSDLNPSDRITKSISFFTK